MARGVSAMDRTLRHADRTVAAARVRSLPAPIILLAATLGYGAVAGGHVAEIVDWLKDARDQAANAAGFRIAADCAHRPERSQPRRGADHRRRDRPRLAFVPRCRGGARPAHGQSLDRRRGRAQALSRPSADQRDRAAGFRALAEGRHRQRHRCRRHDPRAVRRGPLSRLAASGRQRRRARGSRFPRHCRPLSRHPRHAARFDFHRRAPLEPAAQ